MGKKAPYERLERLIFADFIVIQSKISSFLESVFNVIIGFAINTIANLAILPMIGFNITASQNLFIGSLYTIISVARSYAIRRWFNARIRNAAARVAERF